MAFRPTLLARDWLITTEHYLSAEAGASVLRDGGNAMDAAGPSVHAACVVDPPYLGPGASRGPEVGVARVTAWDRHACARGGRPRGGAGAAARTMGWQPDHPPAGSPPATPHALLTALERWGTRPFGTVAAAARDLAR